MSDSIKAWREMQEEKLVSLQADEAIAKALKKTKMGKMKQLDEMANKLVPQIIHKIQSTVWAELSYSDLDLEGDDMNDAQDYVMTLVINKLIN